MITAEDIDAFRDMDQPDMPRHPSDLDEADLHAVALFMRNKCSGEPFHKNDLIPALIEIGFPEYQHGKPYAKKHVGTVLHRLSKLHLARKVAAGRWMVSM